MESSEPGTRKRAAIAFGTLGGTRAVFPLSQTLADGDRSVRLEIVRSLGEVAWRSKTDRVAVATTLIQSLDDLDLGVVTSALDVLVRIGMPALGPIEQALDTAGDNLKRRLESARNRIEEEKRPPKRPMVRDTHIPGAPRWLSKETPLDATEIPLPITDDVHFSVTAPRVLNPGAAFILDIWAHLGRQRKVVIDRAREAQSGRDARIRSKGPVQVERGATMQVCLRIPNFGIEDLQDTIYWTGQVGNSTFPVTVPHDASPGYHLGTMTVFVGGLQIARLSFDLEVGSEIEEADDIISNEIRIKSAFASYASEDRNEVLGRIQGMLKLLPDLDIFLDVVSL